MAGLNCFFHFLFLCYSRKETRVPRKDRPAEQGLGAAGFRSSSGAQALSEPMPLLAAGTQEEKPCCPREVRPQPHGKASRTPLQRASPGGQQGIYLFIFQMIKLMIKKISCPSACAGQGQKQGNKDLAMAIF